MLAEGYADSLELRRLAGMLAELARCPVDQLDLRGATTVMPYRFVTTGQCGWAQDAMKRMVGFRNIAVHEYFAIRWDIAWVAAAEEVPALKEQVEKILQEEFQD